MKKVEKVSDIPTGRHFAVLIYKTASVFIPGDERSRTNPGHGYPERTETYSDTEHWVTENKDDLVSFIKALEIRYNGRHCYQRDPYVFFEVVGLGKIETTVKIDL